MLPFLYEPNEGPVTFAQPGESSSFGQTLATVAAELANPAQTGARLGSPLYRNLFSSAERQNSLTENLASANLATEEAYDRRIKAIEDATGEKLLNPMRGGYWPTLRERRDAMQEDGTPTDVATLAGGKFETALAELRAKNPDQAEALTFGNIGDEAKAIAKGAEDEYEAARRNPKLTPVTSLLAQFGGGLWGQRRDPLFVGSLFLGPTSAVGKSTIARIASSGVFQGLYNAGISALEQPSVQAWRQEIGVKSGVMPAIENIGMAFLFGLIPGAAIRAVHEVSAAARQATQRVLAGHPEPGDVETALKATGAGMTPEQTAAIRMGEDMQAADRAILPPKPKDVSPELHDDMMAAELKRADDPTQPSAQAVAFINAHETADTPPGMVRLYRVDRNIDDMPKSQRPTVADWMKDTDYYRDLVKAEGRWFAADRENIEWYINAALRDGEKPKVTYVDVPISDVESYRVSNLPEGSAAKEFSRLPEQEFFLPRDLAGARQEIAARVAEAEPKTLQEAQVAASEAIEDIGNRSMLTRLQADLADEKALRGGVTKPVEAIEPPPARSKDPLDKIPMARDDGTPTLVSARQAARAGERETKFADIIRECK